MSDEISLARTIEDALRQCELPRLTDIQLEALEEIALLDRTLEPVAQSIVSVTREVAALRALVEVAQADAQRFKQDHLNACSTIADMHRAAVGYTGGPIRGVVEDVEDLRARWLHKIETCIGLRIQLAQLRLAFRDLIAIARSLTTDQDQTERARIDVLEKVLDASQETPTR